MKVAELRAGAAFAIAAAVCTVVACEAAPLLALVGGLLLGRVTK